MNDKIKKLCSSTREDITLAMILMTKLYSKEELQKMVDSKGRFPDLKTSVTRGINKVYYKREYCLFDSIYSCIMIAVPGKDCYSYRRDKKYQEEVIYI